MTKQTITAAQIDDLLPQTQCGLCGYGGCRPYAEAIAHQNEKINLCPPGGVKTLIQLAELMGQDTTPFIPDMQQKSKPSQVAIIREAECIGCTKCIQACPVDAIIGAGKWMHTIITDECTGCELCIEPCPVDCIDLTVVSVVDDVEARRKAHHARLRFEARNRRLVAQKANKINMNNSLQSDDENRAAKVEARRIAIEAAVARVKFKKGIKM